MKAWFVSNGYYRSEAYSYVAEAFGKACARRGVEMTALRSNEISYIIKKGEIRFDCPLPDFVIFWDKDLPLAYSLEKLGVRVYNSPKAIEICDDKIKTACALAENGVPMPDTVFAPMSYPGVGGVDPDFLGRVEKALGYPMVVKEACGSLGRQVYLAKDRSELEKLRLGLMCSRHLYQKFVSAGAGRDVRVIVVGGRAVAHMVRENKTDFRANIELGGKAVRAEIPPSFVKLAEKAASVLRLDYAGVDLLFGEDGPLVCEVNSNAFFRGLEGCAGVDVAEIYLGHILEDRR